MTRAGERPSLAALDQALAPGLAAFLPRQRWFGGAELTPGAARLADLAWLPGERLALAIVAVHAPSGPPRNATLLLRIAEDAGDLPQLAPLEHAGPRGRVVEATRDPHALRALLAGFDPPLELSTERGGVVRWGDVAPGEAAPRRAEIASAQPVVVSGEQSHTSVICGAHVLKLLRTTEPGEQPELEMLRALRRVGFRRAPALRGSIAHRSAAGATTALAVVVERIDHGGDGWAWALERLRAVAAGREHPRTLVEAARALGDTVAELHQSLARVPDPAFAPEPLTQDGADRWTEAAHAALAATLERLGDAAGRMPEDARPLAVRVAGAHGLLARRLTPPPIARGGDFAAIRTHGDLHLGQTLRTRDGFVVIDFEGEPLRPLAERRARSAALRDVAGMRRSFDYLLATASAGSPGLDVGELPLGAAFLQSYRARVLGEAFVPRDGAAFDAWLACLELEKALYEIVYELEHRPGWVGIPLAWVADLLEGEDP